MQSLVVGTAELGQGKGSDGLYGLTRLSGWASATASITLARLNSTLETVTNTQCTRTEKRR